MPEKGLELFVHLIPDTGDLDKLEGKTINAKVNMKPGGMDPGAVGGGGGGGIGMGGVAGGVAMGMGVFSILEKVLGVLTSLEPIQMILEMIGTLLKLFLMPLAIMLMTMLQPVLLMLFKLLPKWYNWLGKGLGEQTADVGAKLVTSLTPIWLVGKILGVPMEKILSATYQVAGRRIKSLFSSLWAGITAFDLPSKIAGFFKGVWGFFQSSWGLVTALEIPDKIKKFFSTIGGFFGGIWAGVTALEIPTKIKNWFLGLPKFFTDLGTDIKGLSIWGDIKSAFGEFGDVIMDALAGVVKAVYDAVNKLPFIDFEYPEWVKKQLNLGEYKETEAPLYVGPQKSPLGPTYYGPDSGNYLPPGDVMGPVYPTVNINVEGLTSEEVLSLIASREWSELQRLTGGG